MIRIGITGQTGFIGTHLFNYLGLFKEEFERVPFRDEYFDNPETLNAFVASCDVIVHLAALNRHNDPEVIYATNVLLVRKLIDACQSAHSRPHILFASSTQEEKDNAYGRSKQEGRELLAAWTKENNALFTGLVIPNVFGPFGHPYYNSVIATFSHQLTHGETPKIEVNGNIKLIYVGELVNIMARIIREKVNNPVYRVAHTKEIYVSEILEFLEGYKANYFDRGIIPALNEPFEINLFNTFRSYIDLETYYPFRLTPHSDPRGTFVEVIKLGAGGQVSFSTTRPGVTRGNHFHTRKVERFAVIKGNARIQLRRIGTEKTFIFDLNGDEPSYVDMPVWYTHNITNNGSDDLYTIFWINEFYDPNDPDTFFEEVGL
jgi:UDP-2-acetamido-2,6-beta-L-arabino-hexul-4-ose reductase